MKTASVPWHVPVEEASEKEMYRVLTDITKIAWEHHLWRLAEYDLPFAISCDENPTKLEPHHLVTPFSLRDIVVNAEIGTKVDLVKAFRFGVYAQFSESNDYFTHHLEREGSPNPYARLAKEGMDWLKKYQKTHARNKTRTRGFNGLLNGFGTAMRVITELVMRSYHDRVHGKKRTNIDYTTALLLAKTNLGLAKDMITMSRQEDGLIEYDQPNALNREILNRLQGNNRSTRAETIGCPASFVASNYTFVYLQLLDGEISNRPVVRDHYEKVVQAFDLGVKPWFEEASPTNRRKYLTERSVALLEGNF